MTHALQGHCPIILISLSFFGFHPIGVKSPHDAKKSGETDLYHFEHIDYIIVHTCVCYMMYWKPTEKMRTWLTWHAQLSSRSKLQKSLYVKYNFWPIVMILGGKEIKANGIIVQLDLRVILAQGPCSHA